MMVIYLVLDTHKLKYNLMIYYKPYIYIFSDVTALIFSPVLIQAPCLLCIIVRLENGPQHYILSGRKFFFYLIRYHFSRLDLWRDGQVACALPWTGWAMARTERTTKASLPSWFTLYSALFIFLLPWQW